MAPIFSYLCADCGYEFDSITAHDRAGKTRDCERCETGVAHRVPSIPSVARGSFGTVRRDTTKQPVANFNFGGGRKDGA